MSEHHRISERHFPTGHSRDHLVEASEPEFLNFLGTRVRDIRTRRKLTRKAAAAAADVSERYLAQVESGEGNVSIVLLRRIAAALGVSLVELLSSDSQDQVEKRLIQRFLERLPAHRLEDLVFRLMRDFGHEEKVRQQRVALIGLRGAGKSTLGAHVAAELGVPFVEIDGEIEKEMGIPLAEIFSLYGQSGYRAIERRTLEGVLQEHDRGIFSVGGGVVSEKDTYEYLLTHCYTVWVKARPEEHMARVMAQGDLRVVAGRDRAMEDLRGILESREPLYRRADLVLDTSGATAEQSSEKLKAAVTGNFS